MSLHELEQKIAYTRSLDCVHCGMCLPACPTYRETGRETSSPRGRIYLMRALAEDRLPPSEELVRDLDQCLVCLACQTACPAGVQYGDMITLTRNELESLPLRSAQLRKWKRFIFRKVLPSQRRLKLIGHILALTRNLGLPRLMRLVRFDRVLPKAMMDQEPFLQKSPSFSARRSPKPIYRSSETLQGQPLRDTVGLLVGCAAHQLVPEATWASIQVLNHIGMDVICPPSQPCCGALAYHFGDLETARIQALRTMDAFADSGVKTVLTTAAGCGSAMKEYPLLFENTEHHERALAFVENVQDISLYLSKCDRPTPGRLELKVAYDDPCHLLHGQGIHDEPRELLNSIPGLKLIESEEASSCCGAAGIYGVLQPELSNRILSPKIEALLKLKPDVIATGNPGCLMQIHAGLRKAGSETPVRHPIELVAEAYRLPRK